MNRMNRGKILAFGFVLAQAFCVSADVTYKPDWDGGSGTWTDGSRYYEGRPPVAANKEILFFNPNRAAVPQSINVTLTDADWATLMSLGISRLQPTVASARIEMNFNEDVSWNGQLYGGGTFVKTGMGAFRLTQESSVAFSVGGRVIVSNGTFKVGNQYQSLVDGGFPVVEVQSPGVFQMPSSSLWLAGLTGDGSVTCAVGGQQLCFMGSNDEHVFSGSFLTNISLTAGTDNSLMASKPKCRQYFTGTDYAGLGTLRIYAGTLGAVKFGLDGEPSSLGGGTGEGNRRFHIFESGYRHSEHAILNLAKEPQTTDRIIRIMNSPTTTNGVLLTVDGGDYGALTWSGAFQNARAYNAQSQVVPFPYWKDHVTPIYLTGANAGGACVLSGAVTEEVTTNHLFFTKRGSGTWRFAHNNSRGFKTPIAIERGTLEYESIAEAGVNCSLGLSTVLSTNWTGLASAYIPYAFLLGDGSDASVSDLATFRYAGTTAASCSTRPIGILGAGRILDDNADATVLLSGVSAASPSATLVLDGTRTDSEIDNVTNGVGVLSVEKRGTGTWTLDGNLAYTGATTVREGTLALKIAAPDYKWYRLTFKNVYGASQYNYLLQRIAFFAADGIDQALGLTYNSSANGKIASLQPGQCAYGDSDTTCASPLDKLFTAAGNEQSVYRSNTPVVSLENPSSWVSIVIRLPNTAKPIVKYDFVPGWYTHAAGPFGRTPTDWDLEASADGVNWDPIDSERDQTKSYSSGGLGDKYWVSDASLFSATPVPTAYPVETHGEQHFVKPTALADVSVANDAILMADAPLITAKLTYDLTEGAGTISGLKFAAAGVIDVKGEVVRGQSIKLAYDLTDCSDVANLANWQVSFNGQLKLGYWVAVRADGLEILPPGMLLIVR